MLNVVKKICCLLVIAVFVTGCTTLKKVKSASTNVNAVYTPEPIKIDGSLADKAWAQAPSYNLKVAKKAYDSLSQSIKQKNMESGKCKLLWDKDNLYIGIDFSDSDIYAFGKKDEMHHYLQGDVAEVFIKPEGDTYYWELYVTPAGRKSSFFIPGRGCLMKPTLLLSPIKIKVASKVDGTLNKWQDKDTGWTAEMAIPRKELEKYGAKFNPDEKWKIFISRYNYSRYLSAKETSSFPRQTGSPNFHRWEEYGKLKLVK
jgi:hypothetical protein